MSRRSTSVAKPPSNTKYLKEMIEFVALIGSLLLVACLYTISYVRDEAAADTSVVKDVQNYSLTLIVIVGLTASMHYFSSTGSGLMKFLVLGLSITGLVISCVGIRDSLKLTEDGTATYSDEYKVMRWFALGGFTSSLLFSIMLSVKYLDNYRLQF